MKKFVLFATALLAVTVSNAQTVLWNGENKELNTDGGFWPRADPKVVEDPEGGNKCLKITLKENSGGWADEHRMAAFPLATVNLNGLRRISMRIKMSENHDVLVKLTKEGAGGYTGDDTRRWFYYGSQGNWQTLVFEYGAGPNSENIVDEGNTLIEIYPYEFDAGKWGEIIYIDDICLEGPVVGSVAARTLEDASLTGNVIVTGSVKKGQYLCTWDGDRHSANYDDYAVLLRKLANNATSIDLRDAQVADGDGPQLRTKNPNMVMFAPAAFYENDNVVVGAVGEGTASKLVLNEGYPFATPENFTAASVELTRQRFAGINSFVLPFWASATELGASNIGIYKEENGDNVVFTLSDHAEANVPFLATGLTASTGVIEFSDKGVVATPANFDSSNFKGVYAPQSATGLWGINGTGKLQKGGSTAKINAFHAYLAEVTEARSVSFEDEGTTGIAKANVNLNANKDYFNLNGQRVAQPAKGLYIVNGKKVIVR